MLVRSLLLADASACARAATPSSQVSASCDLFGFEADGA